MELLQLIEGIAVRYLNANNGSIGPNFMDVVRPNTVPADASPYRAPNGLWFWAVRSKKETVQ